MHAYENHELIKFGDCQDLVLGSHTDVREKAERSAYRNVLLDLPTTLTNPIEQPRDPTTCSSSLWDQRDDNPMGPDA